MTAVLLIESVLLVAMVVGVFVVIRHAGQVLERLAADANVTSRLLVATVEHERDARRDDIQMLLQRIQAPSQAVLQHAVGDAKDQADVMPRSEAESAQAGDQQIMAREILAEIQRMETEANLFPGVVVE